MKNILGLDLGTNSVGWAMVQCETDTPEHGCKVSLGSRIIPMTQDVLSTFDNGGPIQTQTAARRAKRGARRLYERHHLRRERLLRILHLLGWLPTHFDSSLGWDKNDHKTFAKPINTELEVKLPWDRDEAGKPTFLFSTSFKEMLGAFKQTHPNIKNIAYDWTLYYLRDKALREQITPAELAWVLLSFNQKRGYYQLRGKDELPEQEDKTKVEEYLIETIVSVEQDPTSKPSSKGVWYNVTLSNGMAYLRQSKTSINDWIGKRREFVVTTEYDSEGNPKKDKEGNVKRSFRSPGENDWGLKKVRTEDALCKSGLTVGSFIYHQLLNEPTSKIIGQYVQVIDRHYYKEELRAILKCQSQFYKVLTDSDILLQCVSELYSRNEAHAANLIGKDLASLIIDDILFYQRPLKSKKSLISDCPYEAYKYIDSETGEVSFNHIKCIARSNPFFQEFRIRQFISNLKIYDTTGFEDIDVTSQYIQDKETLYTWLSERPKVSQDSLFTGFLNLKKPRGKDAKWNIRWNYVEDKEFPAGETYCLLQKLFDKANLNSYWLKNESNQYRLWHLMYSIDNVAELFGAVRKFAVREEFLEPDKVAEIFSKAKPFDKQYGSYSEKAIKKLLVPMRQGKRVDEACYEVYQRHSEAADAMSWQSPSEMQEFINNFQQYSLRNPIVEQCILETLRTTRDIWMEFGHIDEIHVEIGREMKNPADKRKRISEQNSRNEATNLRIKALLTELLNDPEIMDVRPNSPMQQDILRIYEEGALLELKSDDPQFNEITEISKTATPSASQLTRYKLWLEQRYRSPYTGRVIPLSRLFTTEYEIEHVIPRARYFDNSLHNKVICESEVNKLKGAKLAHEFISDTKFGGTIVQTTHGDVRIFNKAEYETFVKEHYSANKSKMRNLMLDDIPEEFIKRQLNDSRYISKVIKSLLSSIVRDVDEDQDISRNLIVCTGQVTDRLKKDWGLNDVWNKIVSPRYKRLNAITGTDMFGHQADGHFQTSMPLAYQAGYSKKRIDHRHHAMDALVIACASRNIVNLLSNQNAHLTGQREDLKRLLIVKDLIRKPWDTFTQDAQAALESVIVSFRNKVRVLTKGCNTIEKRTDDGERVQVKQNAGLVVRKPLHKETCFGHVNLRRIKEVGIDTALKCTADIVDASLRKTITELQENGMKSKDIKTRLSNMDYNLKKVQVWYFTDTDEPLVAVRKPVDDSFDAKTIQRITDTGIQAIMLRWLEVCGNDPKIAFSAEGIVEMNSRMAELNNGRDHKPILKVRLTEPMGEKHPVGYTGTKGAKYVEGQSGTNLYFAIYQCPDGSRSYRTIPLAEVVERVKEHLAPAPENDGDGQLLMTLSPNDLVYVPTPDEQYTLFIEPEMLDNDRIYKFVSSSKNRAYFVPHRTATPLISVKKDSAISNGQNLLLHEISVGNTLGKVEKMLDSDIIIKSVCWKLQVNRLGQIINIIR